PAAVVLVARLYHLLVGKPQADAEDAVHALGVDAVDLLVLEPQGGGGGMRPAFVEAGLEHPLDVLGKSALDAVEAEAEAAVHPELLVLGEPAGPVVGLPHLRRPVAELRRPVLDPQVAGHPGHIDVAVGGDDLVAHGRERSSTNRRGSRYSGDG